MVLFQRVLGKQTFHIASCFRPTSSKLAISIAYVSVKGHTIQYDSNILNLYSYKLQLIIISSREYSILPMSGSIIHFQLTDIFF